MSSVPFSVSSTKSQPASRKVVVVCISAVVCPMPPPLSVCPEVCVSQKEASTSPGNYRGLEGSGPTSPPDCASPLTSWMYRLHERFGAVWQVPLHGPPVPPVPLGLPQGSRLVVPACATGGRSSKILPPWHFCIIGFGARRVNGGKYAFSQMRTGSVGLGARKQMARSPCRRPGHAPLPEPRGRLCFGFPSEWFWGILSSLVRSAKRLERDRSCVQLQQQRAM